jgi:eukaryotic-like serine/threonine-protein kinase
MEERQTSESGRTPEVKAIGADDRDLAAGDKVGEYEIEAKIGEGGFGTVFRAQHPLIGKLVAIKVLARQYSAQPEMVSRFVAEARAVNQIRHRHIIDIFAFGQLPDGRHYYVMELLDGEALDEHLAAVGRIPLGEAIPILRAIARALDAAHGKGIAHRDLKPENVFLAREADGSVFPKLLDFGIAKLLSAGDVSKHKTRTGSPLGTPLYMSPEQCRGRDVDHRTDIYAFGVVAFKLLTGKVPFDGDSYMDILLAQINDAPPLPSSIAPELPPAVDQGILWMLQKDPAARPPNLVTAVRALEDAAVAAGFEVAAGAPTGVLTAARAGSQPGPRPLSEGLTPTMRAPSVTPAATPSPSSLGMAATIDAARLSDALVAAPVTPVPPAPAAAPVPRRSPLGLGLALAGAVAVGVVVFLALRPSARRDAAAPSARRAPLVEPAAPAAAPPRPALPEPSPPVAPPAPVSPALVAVTVNGPPAGTEVYGPGGRLLGTAPGAIQLEAGEAEVVLTFRADGFVTRSMPVAAREQTITVELEAKAVEPERPQRTRPARSERRRPKGPPRTRDTIEDPFKMP